MRERRTPPAGWSSSGGSEREHRVPLPDGRTLACLELGDPGGAALLYFHGFPGSRREGRLAADAGARLGLRVLAPDRPGFGESTFLAGRTIGSWAEDVAALADRFSLDRFAVLGVSGGGPYALACAARIPERLSRVALVCPLAPAVRRDLTAGMVTLNRRALSLAARTPSLARLVLGLVARLARRYPDRFFAHMDASAPPADQPVLADPRHRALLAASTVEALRQGGRGLAHELVLLGRPWDFDLADVPLRVPIWQGLDDNIVPPAMARYLAEALPRGEPHYIPGEGHVSLIVRHLEAVLGELRL